MVTNRERLNKMSNEELAKIIDEYDDESCNYCAYYSEERDKMSCIRPYKKSCKDGIIEWLNQESEV